MKNAFPTSLRIGRSMSCCRPSALLGYLFLRQCIQCRLLYPADLTAHRGRSLLGRDGNLLLQTIGAGLWGRMENSRTFSRNEVSRLLVLNGLDDVLAGGGARWQEAGEDADKEAGEQGCEG